MTVSHRSSSITAGDARDEYDSGLLWLVALLVLATTFVGGGSSTESGYFVMAGQWLALPLMLWSALVIARRGRFQVSRVALLVLVLVAALPLAQLLPLPASWWHWPAARVALARDLAAAGVTTIDYRWSLTPLATERDFYQLLPAIALFLAALALGRDGWRRLLWCVIGLAIASLLLAFVQIGAAQDSFLNPYPQYAPVLAGVFANKNHQASALAIGFVMTAALLLTRRHDGARAAAHTLLPGIALLVLFGVALPLVKSRAGVIIALVVSGFVLLVDVFSGASGRHRGRVARILLVLALVGVVVGIASALAWMQEDVAIAGSRWTMLVETLRLGLANLPFGSGFGSFALMFEQATRGALMHTAYINNAHNDYAQLWFEGGIAAVAVLVAALLVIAVAGWRLLRLDPRSTTRRLGLAAFAGVLVLLLHSTVDYPLRTPALMAVFGALSGIVVAAAADARGRETRAHRHRHREPRD